MVMTQICAQSITVLMLGIDIEDRLKTPHEWRFSYFLNKIAIENITNFFVLLGLKSTDP